MSVQATNPPPLTRLNRSGSINLLRGRTGSLRKRDGHKRSASNQAMTIPAQLNMSTTTGDAWDAERTSFDKRPVVSYAVTITAGPSSDSKKPKEKRRMFERILHKRNQSRGLLPQIEEGDGSQTPKRSITPALIRDGPRPGRRVSRGHSRSTSALSFFQAETSQPIREDEEEMKPWPPTFPAGQTRPGSSEDAAAKNRSPIMSRYNPSQPHQRKPAPIRSISDETTVSSKSEDVKADRPKLAIVTQQLGSSLPLLDALHVAHPPRKSSLPGTETIQPDPERPSSKDALAKSFESSANHRRQRSKDLVNPVINIMDPTGPTPPPKDNDKGYHVHQLQQQLQDGLQVTIPDRSPLRVSEIFGEAGPRQSALDNVKSSSRSNKNNLPSPRLSAPRQSTLASRRKAIPSSLKVTSRPRKLNMHGVLGGVLSPSISSNRVKKSRGSSRSSSKLSSPAVGKAITTNDTRILTVVPPVPARKAPPPPLALNIPRSQSQIPTEIIRAPVIPEDEKRPTPPAKSPRRISAMKRRSLSDGHVPILAGSSSARTAYRKRSVHRRKPTGFRLTKEKEADLRGRQAERPAVPSLEQTAQSALAQVTASTIGRRLRSQSPQTKTTGLTPPQSQGEWADVKSRGRRQPSPLRSGESADGSKREQRPEIGRNGTDTSGLSTFTAGPVLSSSSIPPRSRAPPTSTSSALRPAHIAAPSGLPENPRATRQRAPSRTAMLPMAPPMMMAGSNPLAAHPSMMPGSTPEERAAGRQKLVEAGHRVTAEESIKRMMERQEQQAVAMRMKLLGVAGR